MEYRSLNDNELLYMVNEDEEAYNLLYNKYRDIIYKIALKYSKGSNSVGIDINDLILEGNIGMDNAIKNYKTNNKNEASFKSFLYLCIERQIISLIRKATIKRNSILNNSSYYEPEILENIEDENKTDILEEILLKESQTKKYKDIIGKLTNLEKQIFTLKIQCYTNKEIEKILNINDKCIKNAIYRIRKKAKLLNFNSKFSNEVQHSR